MPFAVSEDDDVAECAATEWSSWSPCGVTCGKGISMRTRDFADEERAAAVGCDRQMIQKEMCSADGGAVCHGSTNGYPTIILYLPAWAKWQL